VAKMDSRIHEFIEHYLSHELPPKSRM